MLMEADAQALHMAHFWSAAVMCLASVAKAPLVNLKWAVKGKCLSPGSINAKVFESGLQAVLEPFLLSFSYVHALIYFTIQQLFWQRAVGDSVYMPSHLAWAFCRRVWMPGMPAHLRTSFSGVLSCY